VGAKFRHPGLRRVVQSALRLFAIFSLAVTLFACNSLLSEVERIRKKYEDKNKPADCAATQSCDVSRSVGGSVSGLTGTLVLRLNGGNDLSLTTDGAFTFASQLAQGAAYSVTVFTQPSGQTCTVSNATGTVGAANITNVNVTCVNNYTLGGTISGLAMAITLQNNGGDNLSVSANGSFTFATAVADGSTYNVTVLAQQAGQNCTITNGSGTVSGANITNVAVTCVYVCAMSRLDVIQPSNWSLVQGYLQAEAAKGVSGAPLVYTITGPPGTDRWHGGVLATNGKIYGNPLVATNYIEIDPTLETFATVGSAPGGYAYTSGTLASNGKIYHAPYSQTLPRVFTPPSTASNTTGAAATGGIHFTGTVMAPNGFVYGMPNNYTQVLKINPSTDTHIYFGSPTGTGYKWAGGVLAPNGKIYGIPSQATDVLEIDTTTDTLLQFGIFSSGADRWHGGALANTGKIYAAPGDRGTILEIDPVTHNTQEIGSFAATAFNYMSGVYAPNGKIYFVPHIAQQVIELDPSTNTTQLVGPVLSAAANKWVGGVLASNGKIYAIPRSSSSTILVIDTRSVGTLCTPVLESAYFNKY
jgi:hypothetical protein